MGATTYGISWLYGEFRIARFHKGIVEAEWQAPELVNTQAALIKALDDAGDHIDLSIKGDVTIVHEHDLHTHEYLEVPTMRRRDLEKYLLRKVEQSKAFDQEPAWCYHEVRHEGGKEGVLLHQLPKNIVDSTVAACTAAGLAPKRYVPLTEVVSDYLPTTPVARDQMVLVLACFEERIEIVVARGDGEALFVRELNYGAKAENTDRLYTDVVRTIRYHRQQMGHSVNSAWIMGHPEPEVTEQLIETLDIPVTVDELATQPNFWSLWSTKLSGKLSANFISVFAQRNITVDVVRRFAMFGMAATMLVAAVLTIFTSGIVAHSNDQISLVELRSQDARDSIARLKEVLDENNMGQEHLSRLRAASHNMPSLLLLHLSQLTPPEVTLTEVIVEQST
ncbi:MAG: hypothetical protein AAF529_21230, partial [Pseudomonadota bacterium]